MLKRGLTLLVALLILSLGLRAIHAFHLFEGLKPFRIPEFTTVAQAKENSPQKKAAKPSKTTSSPSLDIRLKELQLREEQIKQEEANLHALQKDVEAKIQQLKALEVKVGKLLKKRDELEEKRLEQLARVFESTPPEQAGPLLSKLDVKTAAEILYRMNGRKAGKIWGYVKADRAVKISEELTKLQCAK